ncbi:hypothetical protein [Lacihabitans soyangensis]|uniref:Uncharacterized protein n=1 Tax=Lacihabitans soyangensis TaxID=869394 RepID=A0AAE3H0H0_9BACT|nr:hypothetical protein [Lacihabitans soyangensis]MCP9762417.1 hypothetical protein [Lacihabitans soyangensis]
MTNLNFSILLALTFLGLSLTVKGQYSIKPEKDNVTFTVDRKKSNNLQIVFLYEGIKGIETEIEGTLDLGIIDSKKIKFESPKWKVNNSQRIVASITVDTPFEYNEFLQKSCFLKMTSKTQTLPITISEAKVQISFDTTAKEVAPKNSIFRLNLGSNFDYLQTNPFRLLYLDANIMSPSALSHKSRKGDHVRKCGVYGRIFQFQGMGQINNRPQNLKDSIGIYGNPTIIRTLKNDSVTYLQSVFYRKTSEILEIRNYGASFGLSTPIVDDNKNSFYLSLGIHYEGLFTYYNNEISYTQIYTDTLTSLKKDLIGKYSPDLPKARRSTSFTSVIGFSLPISWSFSSFELRILPAVSIFSARVNPYVNKSFNWNPSYSIYANLTEIKTTGINLGCEIRGNLRYPPSTFNIFVAKTFNLEKLGEFLKI